MKSRILPRVRFVGLVALVSAIFGTGAAVLDADPVTYVDRRSSWRYFLGEEEASSPDWTEWRQVGFDDSSWDVGDAAFGYDDGPFGTDLSTLDPPMRNNFLTLFLRQSFELSNPAAVIELEASINYDDGFAIWINDVLVLEENAPGDYAFDSEAPGNHESGDYDTFELPDPNGYLRAGTNVIAVQVFNTSITSSDLHFDIELVDPIGVDASRPRVDSLAPAAGSRIRSLTSIEVRFDEAVTGVNASDLRINGSPASGLTGSADGPYVFSFAEPPDGNVDVAWVASPGIEDLAPVPNAFQPGAPWTYDLDPNAPLGMVVINEILASNAGGLADDDSDTPDWFELKNIGSESVNLSGWSVTDDPNEPGKFVLPARNLSAGGYLVIFASAKDRAPGSGEIHASFKLNTAPEYLGLFANGSPRSVMSELVPTYPTQRTNIAYGRTNAGAYTYLLSPTPGASNSGSQTVDGFVPDPIFSHPHGYYSSSFSLELTSLDPDADLYYTTDGSVPSRSNGTRYSGSISITGTSSRAVRMIRVVAENSGFLPSNVITQTYVFPQHVLRQPSSPSGFPSSWPGTSADYQMDPQVINNRNNEDLALDALNTLPAISIVAPMDDLFGSSNGVVMNPSRQDYEKEVSCEIFYPPGSPDGDEGVQIDCGFRVQGGSSTNGWKSKKTSFRIAFRSDFGASKLRYQFFEDSPVDVFDSLVLDAHLNLVFTHPSHGQRVRAQYVRDMYVSDLQLAMGSLAPHSRLCNVYINGLFWGVFDVHERPDNAFCEEHLGGQKEEWDIFRHSGNTVVDGNGAAWNTMISRVRANLSSTTNYLRAAEYLDVLDFADYMLVNIYAGNTDWPHHNWYAGRRRVTGGVFRFFSWDAEHVLKGVNDNRVNDPDGNTPGEIFSELRDSAEFRLLFADRAHFALFNGGPLYVNPSDRQWDPDSPEDNVPAQLYMKRIDEIDRAMVLESARWGDVRREPPYTREETFLDELDWLLRNYFPERSRIVLSQLRSANLYPNVDAPVFNRHGGEVSPGFSLSITRPAGQGGTIWYTLDGADPREFGSGDESDSATQYSGSIEIETTTHVKARIKSGSTWSALNETIFTVPVQYGDLLVTEIMYHAATGSQLDFLELKNDGAAPLNLSGLEFTNGIDYQFPQGSVLPPGGFFVLAANATAFDAGYPGIGHDDVFGGSLDNGGETITLVDPLGREVFSFRFDDTTLWPISPDGFGFSLVLDDTNGEFGNPSSWRASAEFFGSPGEDDPPPLYFGVIISEVLARTPAPLEDAVELRNTTGTPIDIGGWYLSDDREDILTLRKFRIPSGTVIPGGDFVVFYENDFNRSPGSPGNFALNGAGDQVYLSSADEVTTDLTGYITGASWNALEDSVSFGRYETSAGPDYTPLLARTFGADDPASVEEFRSGLGLENSDPLVDPVVIHEIHYHPGPGGDEYIELFNLTSSPVDLFDDGIGRGWQLRGVSDIAQSDSYEFPDGASIGGNGFVLLVPIDPALFRSRYGIPGAIPIHGPYGGSLDNGGERLRLMRPAPTEPPDQPYILVDKVVYDDEGLWPTAADGGGRSLERRIADEYGNDPQNWGRSDSSGGTPGSGNSIGPPPPNQPPSASFTASPQSGEAALEVRFDASDSVDPDGRIVSYEWRFDDGDSGAGRVVDHTFDDPGVYDVRLTVTDDDDDDASATVRVTVTVALPNEDPTAAFTFDPPTGEAALTVTFDASDSNDSDGSIARYDWVFDDGNIGSGRITGHTFTTPGDYTVRLTVTDDDDATATTTHDLTVTEPGPNQSPVPSFTMSPNGGDPPLQVTVDASASDDPDGSIVRYSWDFGDGGVGLGRVLGHNFSESGEYTITLTVRDDNDAEASTSRLLVVGDGAPNQSPTASFTLDPSGGEAPILITVDASASSDPDGEVTRYSWNFGDGGVGLGRVIGHTFQEDGEYQITLTVEDDDGATSSTIRTLTLGDGLPNEDPVASFTVAPDRGAPPLEVRVDASASSDPDGSISSYTWDFGDSGSGVGRILTHTYEREGTFTITLIVRDNDSALAFATATVVIESVAPTGNQRPGDCNQDGGVDVSDAVCFLGHLFLGSPAMLPCGDGSLADPGNDMLININDDAGGDLADAIYLLAFLFQGGTPPTLGNACQPMPGCPDACAP